MTGRIVVRNVAVIALALIATLFSVSDIVLPWHPYGVLGVVIAPDRTVVDVTPKSQAAEAGVRVGDRVDFQAMSQRDQLTFNGTVMFARPGSSITLKLVAPGGARRTVTAGVDVVPRTLADNVTNVIECLSNFLSIVVAAVLVMLRPRRFTWAFFIFILLSISLAVTPSTLGVLPLSVATAFIGQLMSLTWIPLTIFALRFPHDAPGKVASVLERALLVSLIVLVPLALSPSIALFGGAVFSPAMEIVVRIVRRFLGPLGLVLAAGGFFAGYRAASPPDRTRMRWVIVGFLAGYSGFVVQKFLVLATHNFGAVLWILNLLGAAPICAPIAVAYAIVRHRVLDVRIVVRRAAVYAVLTTTVVALIAVIDFSVGKIFAGTKIAALGEIGVAVILGLTLNPLHRRLESAVDAAIFRRRRSGEERLRLVADGLIHANTAMSISRLVVHESIEAFGLASAAVFEANASGDYALAESAGWESNACAIDHDSSLVLRLIASTAPLRMSASDVTALPGSPTDARAPALAVPIVFRGELDGFVLFGAHRSGEEIDAEEVTSLYALARAAASAYDHLDARAIRARLAAFEAGG